MPADQDRGTKCALSPADFVYYITAAYTRPPLLSILRDASESSARAAFPAVYLRVRAWYCSLAADHR